MKEVFWIFLKLGLTSFGGPVAHLGYFRTEFVERRKWFDDAAYADLVAVCQFMPGPASSQVGLGIGISRAGYGGALAAWLGFTLPSALLMTAFGYGVAAFEGAGLGWLVGLKAAAVAVVANAALGMGRTLCPDRPRITLAVFSTVVALTIPGVVGQLSAIGLGLVVGLTRHRQPTAAPASEFPVPISRRAGALALALFAAFALGLPALASLTDDHAVTLADAFYRSGALVFGGGHVMLPLLQAEVVTPGWVGTEAFVAGYGAAQAIPGPLFTFSAYLGTVNTLGPNGLIGAVLCVVAIFTPSVFLVVGVLPFWGTLRSHPRARGVLDGVNAAVVGLLLAALYDPVFVSAVDDRMDLALVALAYLALVHWHWPPWLVVGASAVAGTAFMS